MGPMILRSRSITPRPTTVGVGDLVSDAAAAVIAPLTQQIDSKINTAKLQVLDEVKKQGNEAKIYAVAGGLVAGLVGVFIGYQLARR